MRDQLETLSEIFSLVNVLRFSQRFPRKGSMKKILIAALCICVMTTPPVCSKPLVLGKAGHIGGSIAMAAIFGALGFSLMSVIEEKSPRYTEEEKKLLAKVLVTVICAGVGGGLGYWALSYYTPHGRMKTVKGLKKKLSKEDLMKARITMQSFQSLYGRSDIPLVRAFDTADFLQKEIKNALAIIDALREVDAAEEDIRSEFDVYANKVNLIKKVITII